MKQIPDILFLELISLQWFIMDISDASEADKRIFVSLFVAISFCVIWEKFKSRIVRSQIGIH